jgi:hypothetical protein
LDACTRPEGLSDPIGLALVVSSWSNRFLKKHSRGQDGDKNEVDGTGSDQKPQFIGGDRSTEKLRKV